eukprot:CAMPEP_0203773602 /NCGR_PEP_ID=MMETSP0099_2-20121227/4758_1 /ASSEMBLY_ACC=CAM_ASM_000209 /TAXON_ID=96639 /ORGANISM=" , Strain NY0313808BC1" /LENGTH=103 /DNA_ID=CAMNT_0050671469 /DNA_START=380 /DNA_END=687 /DNA_ORIENTATION=-
MAPSGQSKGDKNGAVKDIPYEVKTCKMSPDVEKTAIEVILEALMIGKVEKDIATMIKRSMDAKDLGGTWHSIVGQDFGASLCFDNKHLLFMKAQDRHILLFRS